MKSQLSAGALIAIEYNQFGKKLARIHSLDGNFGSRYTIIYARVSAYRYIGAVCKLSNSRKRKGNCERVIELRSAAKFSLSLSPAFCAIFSVHRRERERYSDRD